MDLITLQRTTSAEMVEQESPNVRSSIKAKRIPATTVKINIFKTLYMSQKLAAIQGVFIQNKWLNLNNKSKTCDVLICPSSIPFLENPQKF